MILSVLSCRLTFRIGAKIIRTEIKNSFAHVPFN